MVRKNYDNLFWWLILYLQRRCKVSILALIVMESPQLQLGLFEAFAGEDLEWKARQKFK